MSTMYSPVSVSEAQPIYAKDGSFVGWGIGVNFKGNIFPVIVKRTATNVVPLPRGRVHFTKMVYNGKTDTSRVEYCFLEPFLFKTAYRRACEFRNVLEKQLYENNK
ncbi:MAG: hypothetical protein IKZ64_01260 [Alphaproteobacteria bacterium]|nr:hypothetical protein [Alphaproteobacteria bacterium]